MSRRIGRARRGAIPLVAAIVLACGAEHRPDPADGSTGVEIVDDAGHAVRLERPARRIVSLVPSATETLVALGAADRVVARTRYDDLPELAGLPSVGGGLDPSVEALVDLRPDVVVAWSSVDDRGLRERLESSGVPVIALAIQDTGDVARAVERLGRLVGRPARADSLIGAIRDTLAAVRGDAIAAAPEVLYLLGGDPPRVAGPRAFVSQLLGVAGGRSPFPEIETRWPAISLEAILERDPDVLVLPRDPGSPDPADLLEGAGWRDLAAVRSGRVGTVDADLVNRPGPGIGRAARALRDTLAALLDRTGAP